jgi:hypothetical protein
LGFEDSCNLSDLSKSSNIGRTRTVKRVGYAVIQVIPMIWLIAKFVGSHGIQTCAVIPVI